MALPDDLGPLAVTVLGSGSPHPQRHRASAAHLVWVDGRPSLLVDAGGGAFERLGRLEVDLTGLDAVLLSHLHIDHSGGLAPVVFGAWMQGRDHPLAVAGPGVGRFCDLLFGEDGAWSYLHGWDGFGIDAVEADPSGPVELPVPGPARVRAVGVPHGSMPAVAYRIDHGGRSLVVSGDVDSSAAGLVALADGADLLLHDQSLPRRDMPHGANHPPPEETAATAAGAGVAHLVLTHLMPPVEDEIDDVVARIAQRYPGRITVAEDLLTLRAGR